MERKLKRSKNQQLAGVCAGIAEYFGWDVTLVRVVYALLSIFSAGFPGLILYIVLWIIMPVDDESASVTCPKCNTLTIKGGYKVWQIVVAIILFPIGLLALLADKKVTKCKKCGYTWQL